MALGVWNTFCFCNLGLFVNLLMGLDFPWQIAVELALYSIVKIPLTGAARRPLLRDDRSGSILWSFCPQDQKIYLHEKHQWLKSLKAVA